MICFAWSGFPQYAARCIAAFVRATAEKVVVIGTRPDVPIEGMEALVGCPVYWVDENAETHTLRELLGELPRLFVVSGWSIPSFNRFRDEVRADGGKVIAMNDGNFIFSLKEVARALRFRLKYRRLYDAFFVPGKSGRRLMRFYGVSDRLIVEGMYSADASVFHDGKPLGERPKRMVYVGRFNERKNVLRLCEAFLAADGPERGWILALYGCGPLEAQLPKHPAIEINAFVQPEQLGDVYRNARCFALASLEEHWGLVVHEGALSGCVLLLSGCIGAAEDFLGPHNGYTFNPLSVESMRDAMQKVFEMDDHALVAARAESLELASRVGLDSFVAGVNYLMLTMSGMPANTVLSQE